MQTHTLAWRGYEIAVQPEQNELGAWRAKVNVWKASEMLTEFCPETVQPEWLTAAEAVRDGIEWGRRFIRQKIEAPAGAV
jgi:hypothetical protein